MADSGAPQDVSTATSTPPKTEREIAKERAKAEKALRFAEKMAKQNGQQATSSAKPTSRKAGGLMKLPPYREVTPRGEKKVLGNLDDDYHKAYNPSVVESAWYDWWEKEGFHQPQYVNGDIKPNGYYTITMPPPNVTGTLHIGHALATSLQDVLIRWNRMKGKTVLYLPGCDHASISTQSVIENMLYNKRNGMTRHDLGRERFVKTVWEWKEEYHNKINVVLRRLGASLDWTREAFTMDANLTAGVLETFVQLHQEGLIYRANRLVNWCTKLTTALSNLEVDQLELDGPTKIDVPGYSKKIEFGAIWHFKYPIDGTDDFIEVATTRPETLLGDTGVAVHPSDERYKHLIGKLVKHPFVERLLPIVGDDSVEKSFATGAVKITPAHDFNDFKRGKDHNLEFVNILNDDGTMNENAGPFAGQKRFDVRYTVITELKNLGLYVGKSANKMSIPLCSKSKDVIEPLMKPQWWMRMRPLTEPAVEAVRTGEIKLQPKTAETKFYRWMESIDDWCLSRQLWWGHQIPAYFIKLKDGPAYGSDASAYDNDASLWVCAKTEADARLKAQAKFPGKNFELERDPDCLDTWFSAGLWPFATLGWPQQTHDLQKLYPTSTLETGWDILFFWVARMMIFGLKMTGKVPFTEVYCHSLVRDSEGRKMSKSLGNVIDPIDIMDGITLQALNDKLTAGNLAPKEIDRAIKWQKSTFPQGIDECGADAVRFSLVNYTTGGGDINFDIRVMRSYRNFCNKIYQAVKYVLGNLPADFLPRETAALTGMESLSELWILHKMNQTVREVNNAITSREFSRATQAIHVHWLYELCDIYIENSKGILREGTEQAKVSALNTLYTLVETALRLMHPFMPFLTEELWQRLPRRPNDATKSIVIAQFPEYDADLEDSRSEQAYELVLSCSKGIRSLLQEYGIKANAQAFVQPQTRERFLTALSEQAAIKTLAGKALAQLSILDPQDAAPEDSSGVYAVASTAAVYVKIEGTIDPAAEIDKIRGKLVKVAERVSEQQRVINTLTDASGQQVRRTEEARLQACQGEQRIYESSLASFLNLTI